MWQMGGLGPMQGQAVHFNRRHRCKPSCANSMLIDHPGSAPTRIEYGVNRYVNETRRLYRTLDTHLQKSPWGYIVGDRVTIADISCWGWAAAARRFPFCCGLQCGDRMLRRS